MTMAELSGLPVPNIDWHASDLANEFRKFKALCQLIFEGPLEARDESIKVKYLLIWSGADGIELVSTWTLTEDEKKSLATYWTKFEEFITPKSNFRLARHKLRQCVQSADEPIDSFIKRVRVLIGQCKYTNSNEQMIDTIIEGVRSESAKMNLMKKDETLTVDGAIEIVRIEESLKFQVSEMAKDRPVTTVNAVKHRNFPPRRPPPQSNKTQEKECRKCGRIHPKSECPAHGTTCDGCGKNNHWRAVCRTPDS